MQDGILTALENITNALRMGLTWPAAQPHIEQAFRAIAELRAAPPPLSEVEARLGALEKAVADLHAALSDSPAPVGVQKAVADVEMPLANAP